MRPQTGGVRYNNDSRDLYALVVARHPAYRFGDLLVVYCGIAKWRYDVSRQCCWLTHSCTLAVLLVSVRPGWWNPPHTQVVRGRIGFENLLPPVVHFHQTACEGCWMLWCALV